MAEFKVTINGQEITINAGDDIAAVKNHPEKMPQAFLKM